MDNAQKAQLLAVAAQQHGLFTRQQAHSSGLSRGQIQNLERNGTATRLDRSVWLVTGAPLTDDARALSVALRHGHHALLASHSAAWVWRVPGHALEPIEVLRQRDEHLPRSGRSHTSRCLGDLDVTRRRGIPVTTPVRTIFDLAGRQHPGRTRQDLNNLMSRHLFGLDRLEATLDRLAVRGRPGITVMRELIAEVRDKGEPAGSNLELLVEDLLAAAGFQNIERQVPIYDDAGFIARVDLADRSRRIAIEVDSDRFHGGLIERQLDAEKTARMEQIGWVVARITEREIWWERDALLSRLRRIRWAANPQNKAAS